MDLHLDLSDLAAELQAMSELLAAVEQEQDLSAFPDGERPPVSKPPAES